MRIRWLALIALLPVPSGDTLAQSLPAVVESLRFDQTIRLRTTTRGTHIGRFLRASADTLYLAPERGSGWVHLAAVDRLWVRGTAAKTGALAGAITGGVLGGTLLALLVSALCETDDCATAEGAVVGGLLGAGSGALAGLVIGTFVNRWHRRYP